MAPINQPSLNFEFEHIASIRITAVKRMEFQRKNEIFRHTAMLSGLLVGGSFDLAMEKCIAGFKEFPERDDQVKLTEWKSLIEQCQRKDWKGIRAEFLCIILDLHQCAVLLQTAVEKLKSLNIFGPCPCPVCGCVVGRNVLDMIRHAAAASEHFKTVIKPFTCISPCEANQTKPKSFVHHNDLKSHLDSMLESNDEIHDAYEARRVLDILKQLN